jgi:hypothetical protein
MPLGDLLTGAKPAVSMRDFGDSTAVRDNIFSNVLNAARALPVLENQQHQLALSNIDYEDKTPVRLRDEKKAVLAGNTLSRRLRGTWTLTDKATGNRSISGP